MTELLNVFRAFRPMAEHIIPKRTALPVLKRVVADGNWLIAGDLDHRIQMPFGISTPFALELKMLKSLAREDRESVILQAVADRKVLLAINRTQSAQFFAGSISEYPAEPSVAFKRVCKWDHEFIKMLGKLAPIISEDELKPSLMGVYVNQVDGQAELCGTDGYRLVRISNIKVQSKQYFNGIIHRKAITFLNKFAKDGAVLRDGGAWLLFELGNGVYFYSRAIDERYPDYDSVFLTDCTGFITVNRKELIRTLVSGTPFADSATKQVALSNVGRTQSIKLTAEDVEEQTSWSADMPVLEREGTHIEIGYNMQYLKQLLRVLEGDAVDFSFKSPVTATIITGNDPRVTALLMPIRMND